MPFTLATWNINSVRLREPPVLKMLATHAPDVLCLQGRKICLTENEANILKFLYRA